MNNRLFPRWRHSFIIFCFWGLLSVPLFGGSVTLLNDSPFPLKASLLAADGTLLASLDLEVKGRKTWSSSDTPGLQTSTHSQTPYTVIWSCRTGKEYGISISVSQGSLVSAQSSQGNKVCAPEKKK